MRRESSTPTQKSPACAGLSASLVVSPISTLPTVLNLQHIHLTFAIVTSLARFGGLWLGKMYGSPLAAVICFSAAEATLNLVFLAWVLVVLKRAADRHVAVREA